MPGKLFLNVRATFTGISEEENEFLVGVPNNCTIKQLREQILAEMGLPEQTNCIVKHEPDGLNLDINDTRSVKETEISSYDDVIVTMSKRHTMIPYDYTLIDLHNAIGDKLSKIRSSCPFSMMAKEEPRARTPVAIPISQSYISGKQESSSVPSQPPEPKKFTVNLGPTAVPSSNNEPPAEPKKFAINLGQKTSTNVPTNDIPAEPKKFTINLGQKTPTNTPTNDPPPNPPSNAGKFSILLNSNKNSNSPTPPSSATGNGNKFSINLHPKS